MNKLIALPAAVAATLALAACSTPWNNNNPPPGPRPDAMAAPMPVGTTTVPNTMATPVTDPAPVESSNLPPL